VFEVQRRVVAELGSFTLTGQDSDLNKQVVMSAGSGSFTLTGFDFNVSFTEILDVGQLGVAGQDVTFILGEPVEGVSITVFIGGAAVYGLILPDQDPNWARVTPAQDPQWTLVA
jgi:hypothetical protein